MRSFYMRTSLVFRLRSSLIAILIAVSAVTGFTYLQFKQVESRKTDLLSRSLPILVATQQLVETLGREKEQAILLRDINLYANFETVRQEFLVTEQQLEIDLHNLQQFPHVDTLGISASADALIDTIERMLWVQTERQALQANNDTLFDRIDGLLGSMLDSIAEIRLDLLLELQTAPNQSRPDPMNNPGRSALTQFNSAVELNLLLDAMKEQTSRMTRTTGTKPDSTAAQGLRRKIGSVGKLLTKLPSAAEQRELAIKLQQVRELVVGADGLLSNLNTQANLQIELERAMKRHSAVIDEIVRLIGETTEAAQRDTLATGAALDNTIRSASMSILWASAALGFGILFVVMIIIERQLNRRIQSLIKAVRTIANGDFSRPVNVTGTDEIGEIADALRAFQTAAQDLTRSNTDLKSFAYAASHDLKSPLRAISDLAEWILEDAKDELSEDNRQMLEMLCSRTRRLTKLLNDLLSYAQADGCDDDPEPIDIADEVSVITDLLDPGDQFEITVNNSTKILCYPVPLRQILHNLMSNAIRHHDRPSGKIEVTAEEHDGQLVIEVKDDGPGIPKQFHDRIFSLFQKLESRDQVEGSGIGLALIHKLAMRYNGSVDVVSDPEKARGTRFIVRLNTTPKPAFSAAA